MLPGARLWKYPLSIPETVLHVSLTSNRSQCVRELTLPEVTQKGESHVWNCTSSLLNNLIFSLALSEFWSLAAS
jgi:hypothetical protein